MKKLNILLLAAITFTIVSCNKETATTQTDVMNTLLTNKNWYLDYSITGTSTKSYVGQSTYFVTYLKDGTTNDSDGLTGTYSVKVIGNQSQLHVQVKTASGNPLDVIYDIISVGETKLVLSKVVTTGTPTQLYFTNK
jgi:hypothetical protein